MLALQWTVGLCFISVSCCASLHEPLMWSFHHSSLYEILLNLLSLSVSVSLYLFLLYVSCTAYIEFFSLKWSNFKNQVSFNFKKWQQGFCVGVQRNASYFWKTSIIREWDTYSLAKELYVFCFCFFLLKSSPLFLNCLAVLYILVSSFEQMNE